MIQLLNENADGFGILTEGYNTQCVVTEKIIEGINQTRMFIMSGIMAQGDVRNKNGRMYPFYNVLKPEFDRYIVEVVNAKKAAMEYKHPNTLELNEERICARITKHWYEGPNVLGEAIVGNEGLGLFVQDLFHMGFEIGASTRGTGTVHESIVQNDFRLYHTDVVFNQSAPVAIMNVGVREAQATLVNEGLLTEQELSYYINVMKKMNPADRAGYYKLYQKFLRTINTVK